MELLWLKPGQTNKQSYAVKAAKTPQVKSELEMQITILNLLAHEPILISPSNPDPDKHLESVSKTFT